MATPTHLTKNHNIQASNPGAAELAEELTNLGSGIGLAFTSFLAGIPGLLPMVLLTALGLAIVVIPMLVVGIAFGALLALGWLAARIVSRTVSFITGTRQQAGGLQAAPERPGTPSPTRIGRPVEGLRIPS